MLVSFRVYGHVPGVAGLTRVRHPSGMSGADLAQYLRNRFGPGMFLANLVGAIDVFVLLVWILPTPGVPPGGLVARNAIAFAIFMTFCLTAGAWGSYLAARPVLEWLEGGGPPTPEQRRAALLLPARQTLLHAVMWMLGLVAFTALQAPVSGALARYTAVTIFMGAITTCAVTYLIAERVLRPITALALAAARPARPVGPGVKGRLVLAWLSATGVPVLSIALVGVDAATRDDLSQGTIAVSILVLSGLALASGLTATIVAAKSVAEPLSAVRRALGRVEAGDLAAGVRVSDASEIGLLQSGFNTMAAGLRERERLRDLFGRHVGEDVARAALDAGELALGGEVREIAVLFVDLKGSTALASERP